MEISTNGINLIKKFEGFEEKAYQDVIGIWTIGFGTIQYANGTKVRQGDTITEEGAEAELKHYIDTQIIPTLESVVTVELTQNQIDALASFIYNLGAGAFKKSTLLKLINAGKFADAALEFQKWNRAGGKVVSGLTRRRNAEMVLFNS